MEVEVGRNATDGRAESRRGLGALDYRTKLVQVSRSRQGQGKVNKVKVQVVQVVQVEWPGLRSGLGQVEAENKVKNKVKRARSRV